MLPPRLHFIRRFFDARALRLAGFALIAGLTLVAIVASGREGSSARDKAKNASAGDPDGVSSDVTPVLGSEPGPQPSVEPISPDLGKRLLSEFLRAQSSELKALDHRQKLEIKELKASQAARQKDWERKERDARHQFFAEHTRGPERRAYIKDFMLRRRAYLQALTDERTERAKQQDTATAGLKGQQAAKLKEFKDCLGRNERPPVRLWPS